MNLNRYCNNLRFHFQSRASQIPISSGIVSAKSTLSLLTSMYCLWCWWLSPSRVTLFMVMVALTQHTHCNGLQNHSHPSPIPCNLISGPETRRLPIMPEPVYGPTLGYIQTLRQKSPRAAAFIKTSLVWSFEYGGGWSICRVEGLILGRGSVGTGRLLGS